MGIFQSSQSGRVLNSMLKERFVVSLIDGEGIEGLFLDADAKTIRLGSCFRVTNDGVRVPLDGEMFIPRGNVLYLQKT